MKNLTDWINISAIRYCLLPRFIFPPDFLDPKTNSVTASENEPLDRFYFNTHRPDFITTASPIGKLDE